MKMQCRKESSLHPSHPFHPLIYRRTGARTSTFNARGTTTLIVRAQRQLQPVQCQSRRETGAAAIAAVLGLTLSASPAQAFLGFGDDGLARYTEQTSKIIASLNAALELELDNPGREAALKALRQDSISWVSRYRRDSSVSGRPSFSNLYSAINALDGHLNSFGFASKIPAKRLERIQREVADADRQLQRGR